MAKDFSEEVNGIQNTLAETIAAATAPDPEEKRKPRRGRRTIYQSEEERKEYAARDAERGKAPRINFAFTPLNYDYITTMARVRGQSYTQFLNDIVNASYKRNEQVYQAAKGFLENTNL